MSSKDHFDCSPDVDDWFQKMLEYLEKNEEAYKITSAVITVSDPNKCGGKVKSNMWLNSEPGNDNSCAESILSVFIALGSFIPPHLLQRYKNIVNEAVSCLAASVASESTDRNQGQTIN